MYYDNKIAGKWVKANKVGKGERFVAQECSVLSLKESVQRCKQLVVLTRNAMSFWTTESSHIPCKMLRVKQIDWIEAWNLIECSLHTFIRKSSRKLANFPFSQDERSLLWSLEAKHLAEFGENRKLECKLSHNATWTRRLRFPFWRILPINIVSANCSWISFFAPLD